MSIRVSTDVFCDGDNCSQWCEGVVSHKTDAKAARANAAKKDEWGKRWVHVAGKDLCPNCAAKIAPTTPTEDKAS